MRIYANKTYVGMCKVRHTITGEWSDSIVIKRGDRIRQDCSRDRIFDPTSRECPYLGIATRSFRKSDGAIFDPPVTGAEAFADCQATGQGYILT